MSQLSLFGPPTRTNTLQIGDRVISSASNESWYPVATVIDLAGDASSEFPCVEIQFIDPRNEILTSRVTFEYRLKLT